MGTYINDDGSVTSNAATPMTAPTEREAVVAFIEMIAKRSEALGWQAGVGGMETAGSLISYFAEHPEDIEPFINGGFDELPSDWLLKGRLTWHAQNGKVVSPDFARRARVIKQMERDHIKDRP